MLQNGNINNPLVQNGKIAHFQCEWYEMGKFPTLDVTGTKWD